MARPTRVSVAGFESPGRNLLTGADCRFESESPAFQRCNSVSSVGAYRNRCMHDLQQLLRACLRGILVGLEFQKYSFQRLLDKRFAAICL